MPISPPRIEYPNQKLNIKYQKYILKLKNKNRFLG